MSTTPDAAAIIRFLRQGIRCFERANKMRDEYGLEPDLEHIAHLRFYRELLGRIEHDGGNAWFQFGPGKPDCPTCEGAGYVPRPQACECVEPGRPKPMKRRK